MRRAALFLALSPPPVSADPGDAALTEAAYCIGLAEGLARVAARAGGDEGDAGALTQKDWPALEAAGSPLPVLLGARARGRNDALRAGRLAEAGQMDGETRWILLDAADHCAGLRQRLAAEGVLP